MIFAKTHTIFTIYVSATFTEFLANNGYY